MSSKRFRDFGLVCLTTRLFREINTSYRHPWCGHPDIAAGVLQETGSAIVLQTVRQEVYAEVIAIAVESGCARQCRDSGRR